MWDQDAEALLAAEPLGLYLIEQRGRWLLLWLSESEPAEQPLAPEASQASE
jgi:hypothetical protein